MATLLTRTILINGQSTTVDTSASANIVVNAYAGKVGIEVIIDSAQTDGYPFVLSGSAAVVAAADSLVITGKGSNGGTVEVYAA